MGQISIQRTSLKEQISKIILNRIFSGELQPGERVKELTVAKELGTSQAPVREALRSLESQGYLKHKSHSGTIVITLNADEIKEINQIREALEIQAMTEGYTALQETIYQLDEAQSDLNNYVDTETALINDKRFHQFIFKAYDNRSMFDLWETLTNKLRIVFSKLVISDQFEQLSVRDNAILEALKSGNTRKSIQSVKEYYRLWEHH